MYKWLDPAPPTVERPPARAPAAVLKGSIGVARLDERLAAAPEAVRRGWLSRALVHESVASLRLNGFYVTAGDLTLMLSDTIDRAPDHDLGRAASIHRMLASMTRRHSKNLFRPRRLIALTQLRLRGHSDNVDDSMPDWLRQRRRDPVEMRDALEQALDPAAVAAWALLSPLEASAAIVARWHATGAADVIGAAPGRALAMAWAPRAGLTSGYYLLPSIGFLGHASSYRPDLEARWSGVFLEACERAAGWGFNLHTTLNAAYRRMHEAAPGRRSTSRMARLIDLLIASPAMSSEGAAQSLGVTRHAARGLLLRLEKKGLVHELTGRGSFRLYGLPH